MISAAILVRVVADVDRGGGTNGTHTLTETKE